jgi:hypothetical protein
MRRCFEDCIRFARERFEESFRNTILQLLEQYPLDHVISVRCAALHYTSTVTGG